MLDDDWSYAGAGHGQEAGLQPVVIGVSRLRPRRPDPAQHHDLVEDGPGLQAQVLLAVRVQAALQQTASLGQQGGEQGVVTGNAGGGKHFLTF